LNNSLVELREIFLEGERLMAEMPGHTYRRIADQEVGDMGIGMEDVQHERDVREIAARGTGSDDDPWKHRSARMKCATCMWFVLKAREPKEHATGRIFDAGSTGRCRRRAPTMSGYPVVTKKNWCGDHKLDEEKV